MRTWKKRMAAITALIIAPLAAYAATDTYLTTMHLNIIETKANGTNLVEIKAPNLSASYTLTLPADDGDADEVLQTDGDGNLTWAGAAVAPSAGIVYSNGSVLSSNAITQGGLIYGSASNVASSTGAGTAGQWVLSGGTGAPTMSNTATTGKVIDGSANEIQLRVQGNGTQTAHIFEVEKSTGDDFFVVKPDGTSLFSNADAAIASGTTVVQGLNAYAVSDSGDYTSYLDSLTYGGKVAQLKIRTSDNGTIYEGAVFEPNGRLTVPERLTVGADTKTDNAVLFVRSDDTSTEHPWLEIQRGATSRGVFGVCGDTNDLSAGCAANDLVVRGNGNIVLSVDSGVTQAGKIDTNGDFTLGTTTGGPRIDAEAASTSNVTYGFIGDPNTGMMRDSADSVALIAGGTQRITAAAGVVRIDGLTTNGPVFTSGSNGSLNSEAQVALSRGGSNKNMTASAGGIVWTDSDSMEVLAGTATASSWLCSGASVTPSWCNTTSTAKTFSATVTLGGGTTAMQYSANDTRITADTSDASDSRKLSLAGGGSISTSRGGFIGIAGNEHADAGAITLTPGGSANVIVDNGVVQANNGVKFKDSGAGSDTMTTYIKRTAWSSQPAIATSGNDLTVSMGTRSAYYSRYGDMVMVTGLVAWTSCSAGTGTVRIENLPITNLNVSGNYSICRIAQSNFNLDTGFTEVIGSIAPGSNIIQIYESGDVQTLSTTSLGNLNCGVATKELNFTCTYFAN